MTKFLYWVWFAYGDTEHDFDERVPARRALRRRDILVAEPRRRDNEKIQRHQPYMEAFSMVRLSSFFWLAGILGVALLLSAAQPVRAQDASAAPVAVVPTAVPTAAPADAAAPPLTEAQLEQLVAPIALYPDALLAQVLMAATYPLEVVSASRWAQANSTLKGADLDKALAQQSWDASVISLVSFPQVLQMMNDQIEWTEQLGNAFLAQQTDVMNAVQTLRQRAQAAGNLKSTAQQTVTTEPRTPAPSASADSASQEVIVIQPSQPNVVYVPGYDSTTVYGAWPYPSYPPPPPPSWYSPGEALATGIISFGLGVATGYALWGDCDWHHDDVDIHIDGYNNFYNHYAPYNPHFNPPPPPHGPGPGPGPRPDGYGPWNHNPDHRRGVPYQNPMVQNRFSNQPGGAARNQAREQFRGHADQERALLAGSGNHGQRPGFGGGLQPGQPGQRPGAHAGGLQPLRPEGQPGSHGGGQMHMPSAGPAKTGAQGGGQVHRPSAGPAKTGAQGGGQMHMPSAGPARQQPSHTRVGGHDQGQRFSGGQGNVFSHVNGGGQAWPDRNRGFQGQQRVMGHGPQISGGGLPHGGGGASRGGGGFGGFHGGGGLRHR